MWGYNIEGDGFTPGIERPKYNRWIRIGVLLQRRYITTSYYIRVEVTSKIDKHDSDKNLGYTPSRRKNRETGLRRLGRYVCKSVRQE